MKFKVGDKVRLTREAIASKENRNYRVFEFEVIGVEVIGIKGNLVIYKYKDRCYGNEYEANLELVPEEPEFEYGEAIEVKIDEGFPWVERPFIYFAKGNAIHPYITANINKAQFDAGKKFDFQAFRYARKLRPQLTRKAIAEKFGVSEDFTLVDE